MSGRERNGRTDTSSQRSEAGSGRIASAAGAALLLERRPSPVHRAPPGPYRQDPYSIDAGWRHFFDGYDLGQAEPASEIPPAAAAPVAAPAPATGPQPRVEPKEFQVINLIQGYRSRGHLFTRTNPVRARRTYRPPWPPRTSACRTPTWTPSSRPARRSASARPSSATSSPTCEQTYCNTIGAEYMLHPPAREGAVAAGTHGTHPQHARFDAEDKKQLLCKLTQAVVFEKFLAQEVHRPEALLPRGRGDPDPRAGRRRRARRRPGLEEFVMGMAHRGRLNVLANIMTSPTATSSRSSRASTTRTRLGAAT